jgi:molybdopterin converting factor small subunit
MMGTVRLRVFAWLRKQRPDLDGRTVGLEAAATVQGLLDTVRFVPPEGAIIIVSDRQAGPGTPLRDGDTVSVFPMLEGG